MSGVLERMAKRALGTLPAIQPLAAPRFAPPASRDSEALVTRSDPQTVDLQELYSEDEGLDISTDRPTMRRADKRYAQRSSHEDEPPQMTIHAEEQVTQRVLQEKFAPETPLHRLAEQRNEQARLLQHEGSREAIEPPLNPIPTRPVDQTPKAAIMEEIAAMKIRANVEEPQTEAKAYPRKPPVQEASPRSSDMQIAAPRVEQPEGLTDQHTEIHISIGSIELRAPRSETKPLAPFRPQVPLDDYLRRDRGART